MIFVSSTISDGNMSLKRGTPKEATYNRKKFLKRFGLSTKDIVVMSLSHKTTIKKVSTKDLGKDVIEADGLITSDKGVFLFLLTADCLPMAFYDPNKEVVGLLHVSRHNINLGIISQAIRGLKKLGSDPKDLVVKIGPSIGPCCYILDQGRVDLWTLVEKQLKTLGVLGKNIDNPKVCTYHSGEYFSHRKTIVENLPNDFRFATILGIK